MFCTKYCYFPYLNCVHWAYDNHCTPCSLWFPKAVFLPLLFFHKKSIFWTHKIFLFIFGFCNYRYFNFSNKSFAETNSHSKNLYECHVLIKILESSREKISFWNECQHLCVCEMWHCLNIEFALIGWKAINIFRCVISAALLLSSNVYHICQDKITFSSWWKRTFVYVEKFHRLFIATSLILDLTRFKLTQSFRKCKVL